MPSETVAEALYAALDVSSVTDLATGGVFRDAAQQGTEPPFVVFQFVGGRATEHTLTQKVSDAHLWQVDVYAKDSASSSGPKAADRIMAAVEAALFDHALEVTGKTTLYCRKDMDLPAPPTEEQGVRVYRRSQQWAVEHS